MPLSRWLIRPRCFITRLVLRLRPVLRTRNFARLLARLALLLPTRALLLARLSLFRSAWARGSGVLIVIPSVLSRDRESERQHQAGKP